MILRIIHVKIYTFLVHILIYSVTFFMSRYIWEYAWKRSFYVRNTPILLFIYSTKYNYSCNASVVKKNRRSRAKLGFIFGLTLLVTICFVLKAARPYIKWNIQLFCLSMMVLNDDYDIYIWHSPTGINFHII